VLLRVLGGLTTGETAATIGKSEGAVRVLQHRALRALKDRLTGGDVTL
jgi:RNA polymerase sigma-70 factor (ECF subfamily)